MSTEKLNSLGSEDTITAWDSNFIFLFKLVFQIINKWFLHSSYSCTLLRETLKKNQALESALGSPFRSCALAKWEEALGCPLTGRCGALSLGRDISGLLTHPADWSPCQTRAHGAKKKHCLLPPPSSHHRSPGN